MVYQEKIMAILLQQDLQCSYLQEKASYSLIQKCKREREPYQAAGSLSQLCSDWLALLRKVSKLPFPKKKNFIAFSWISEPSLWEFGDDVMECDVLECV